MVQILSTGPRARQNGPTRAQYAAMADLAPMPAAVATALAAVERVQAMPIPAWPNEFADLAARTAADRVAAAVANDALAGEIPTTLDVAAVAAARADEQSQADRSWVLRRARDYADDQLAQTIAEHSAEVITALRIEHARCVEEILAAHRQLPANCTDERALELGGKVRVAWLTLRDNIFRAEQLQHSVSMVGPQVRGALADDTHCRYWVRADAVVARSYGNSSEVIVGGRTYATRSVELYRTLAQAVPDPSGWWAPTDVERQQASVDYAAEQNAKRRGLEARSLRSGQSLSGAAW